MHVQGVKEDETLRKDDELTTLGLSASRPAHRAATFLTRTRTRNNLNSNWKTAAGNQEATY
jgi:hypothetical protein